MPSLPNTISKLKIKYPYITFVKGSSFVWSPSTQTITYGTETNINHAIWALIHEVAHADLHHAHYKNDLNLIMLESAAWNRAKEIAASIDIVIDEDHIQDCLDTYRDWLHKRSSCPACDVVSLQTEDSTYACFNCRTEWKVPASPLCRVSRVVVS